MIWKESFEIVLTSHISIWFMVYIELPTDWRREVLCFCFWPLLNIPRWLKDPQSNHINVFVLTTWHTDPLGQRPPTLQPQKASSPTCFGKICQFRHVPCQEITRHVDRGNSRKFKNCVWFSGSVEDSWKHHVLFFQDGFPWMSLMMSVVCLGWWADGQRSRNKKEGWTEAKWGEESKEGGWKESEGVKNGWGHKQENKGGQKQGIGTTDARKT